MGCVGWDVVSRYIDCTLFDNRVPCFSRNVKEKWKKGTNSEPPCPSPFPKVFLTGAVQQFAISQTSPLTRPVYVPLLRLYALIKPGGERWLVEQSGCVAMDFRY